jgi:acyl carrier protein phosphodiesterase
VNLLPGWVVSYNLFEKCREILTGMACRSLAVQAACGGLQGSVER